MNRQIIQKLREDIQIIMSALWASRPIYAAILSELPIYTSRQVPTAMTDGIGIYINPDFWEMLDDKQRMVVLVHEALHVILNHPERSEVYKKMYGDAIHDILNIVADAIVNKVIGEDLPDAFKSMKSIVTWKMFDVFYQVVTGKQPPDPLEAGFERLVDELLKNMKKLLKKIDMVKGNSIGNDLGKAPSDAQEVLPGNKEMAEKAKRGEISREEYAKKILAGASVVSKIVEKRAGNKAGHLERFVDKLLKPTIDWRRLLKQALEQGIGKDIKKTWSRPNRKNWELPHKTTMGLGKVHVLVDVSGSISEQELQMFLTETFGLLKQYKPREVWLYFWDVGTRQKVKVTKPSDVKRVKPVGGGGTVILPTLEEVARKLRPEDALVIMSDFYLYDNAGDVANRLEMIRRKTRRIVLLATPNHNRETLNQLSRYASATITLTHPK